MRSKEDEHQHVRDHGRRLTRCIALAAVAVDWSLEVPLLWWYHTISCKPPRLHACCFLAIYIDDRAVLNTTRCCQRTDASCCAIVERASLPTLPCSSCLPVAARSKAYNTRSAPRRGREAHAVVSAVREAGLGGPLACSVHIVIHEASMQ